MQLSVPCTFAPGLIGELSRFKCVAEVYGRLENSWIGGGRTSYTLRHASKKTFATMLDSCKRHRIAFNYLLNAASLYGMEQTRAGQRQIRKTLDLLSESGVERLTVAFPYLLRLVKSSYPHFTVKIGVFAQIDSAEKARRWEAMGADALCISAISCNRDFKTLGAIRAAVGCDLQLIANATCIPSCIYEHTHMDLLSTSSRKNDPLRGFCMDYCFLQCSASRIRQPEFFLKSVWIRPEDLHLYEALGYSWFKLVERSCPTGLLLRRVAAYDARSFNGNLWELVAPVAQVPGKKNTPFPVLLRTVVAMARPWLTRPASLAAIASYIFDVFIDDFSRERSPVYIDNQGLSGFLEGVVKRGCPPAAGACDKCGYCSSWAKRTVRLDGGYREKVLAKAASLDKGLLSGTLWK